MPGKRAGSSRGSTVPVVRGESASDKTPSGARAAQRAALQKRLRRRQTDMLKRGFLASATQARHEDNLIAAEQRRRARLQHNIELAQSLGDTKLAQTLRETGRVSGSYDRAHPARSGVERTQILLSKAGIDRIPGGKKVSQIIGGVGEDTAYLPSGFYYLATHDPRKTLPVLASQFGRTITEPGKTWRERPQDFLYGGLAAYGVAGSAAGRLSAVSRAAASGESRLAAALRRPQQGMRVVRHRDPLTGQMTETYALNFGGPFGRQWGRLSDRITGADRGSIEPKTVPGKLVAPARTETVTETVANASHGRTRRELRAALRERRRAIRAQQEVTGRPVGEGQRPVLSEQRTPEQVDVRIAEIDTELRPILDQVAGGARAEKAHHRTEFVGKDPNPAATHLEEELRANRWVQKMNTRAGKAAYDVEDYYRLKAHRETRLRRDTSRLEGIAWRRLYESVRRLASDPSATPEQRARAQRLKALIEERDSLTQLRQRHQPGNELLFPEETAGGLGVEMRRNPSYRPGAREELVARARLAREAADARAREALQAHRAQPETMSREVTRQVPEVRGPERVVPSLTRSGPVLQFRNWMRAQKVGSEALQTGQIIDAARRAGLDVTHPEVVAEVMKSARVRGVPERVGRSINRFSRMSILYGRFPGYVVSQIPSQEAMMLADQGIFSPVTRLRGAALRNTRTGRLARKLLPGMPDPLTEIGRRRAEAVAGAGRVLSSQPTRSRRPSMGGRVGDWLENRLVRADEWTGRQYGKIIDSPYRVATLERSMRRQGVKTAADLEKVLQDMAEHGGRVKGTGSHVVRELPGGNPLDEARHVATRRNVERGIEAARRSNRNVIDYARMGKGASKLRDYVFLVPWLKGAFHYTAQFPMEHPLQTAALGTVAAVGKENTGLPDLPGTIKGAFKVGERVIPGLGKVPVVVTPRNMGIFDQPFQTGRQALSLVGLTQFSRDSDPSQSLQPIWGALMESIYHIDAFTGERIKGKNSMQIFYEKMRDQIPAYRFARDMISPRERLAQKATFPMSRWDSGIQMLVGTSGPRALGLGKAEQVRRQQVSELASPEEKLRLRATWARTDFLGKYNALARAAGKPTLDRNPPAVIAGIKAATLVGVARAQLREDKRAVTASGGLTQQGELAARLVALGRSMGMSERRVGELREKALSLTDASAAKQYRAAMEKGSPFFVSIKMFNEAVRNINLAGESLKLPYEQGGRKVYGP